MRSVGQGWKSNAVRFGWLVPAFLGVAFFSGWILTQGRFDTPPDPTLGWNTALEPVALLERGSYDWEARHAAVLSLVSEGEFDLIFLGDSITQFFGGPPKPEFSRGQAVWDRYYGHRRALNLGFGWDRTQNVLWRIRNGQLGRLSPRVIVLMIGTNNLMETPNARRNSPLEIVDGIEAISAFLVERFPDCHLVLMGLLPRMEDDLMDDVRVINLELASLGAPPGITVLDLDGVFCGPGGIPRPELMADRVHPNACGYEVWAEALEPILAEYLK